jgi:hypothetical protein
VDELERALVGCGGVVGVIEPAQGLECPLVGGAGVVGVIEPAQEFERARKGCRRS